MIYNTKTATYYARRRKLLLDVDAYVCIIIRNRVSNARVYGVASIVGILLSLVACEKSDFFSGSQDQDEKKSFPGLLMLLQTSGRSNGSALSRQSNRAPPVLERRRLRTAQFGRDAGFCTVSQCYDRDVGCRRWYRHANNFSCN